MERRSKLRQIVLVGVILVLLFVVLSTATYAWYSANNVASAGMITFRSSSSDVGGFLTIGKTKTATGNELTFDTPDEISPMIPTVNGEIGVTKLGQFKQFQKTYEGLNEAGQLVAMLNGTAATPLFLSVDGQEYFYLNNIAPEIDIKVKVEYTVVGELAEKLHAAMFFGEREQDAVLIGVISGSDDKIHYGNIKVGESVDGMPTMESAYMTTGSITFVVPQASSVCIRLAAWLDGVDMKNENGNKTTSFSLAFREVSAG